MACNSLTAAGAKSISDRSCKENRITDFCSIQFFRKSLGFPDDQTKGSESIRTYDRPTDVKGKVVSVLN
jgi:hypothetical protein